MANSLFIVRFFLDSSSWQKVILLTAKTQKEWVNTANMQVTYLQWSQRVFSLGLDAGSSLTWLGHLNQFIIAEFVQVLFHLRDGLSDGAEGEVGVDAHCRQLLGLILGYQHVVALKRKQQQRSYDYVFKLVLCFFFHFVPCRTFLCNTQYIFFLYSYTDWYTFRLQNETVYYTVYVSLVIDWWPVLDEAWWDRL